MSDLDLKRETELREWLSDESEGLFDTCPEAVSLADECRYLLGRIDALIAERDALREALEEKAGDAAASAAGCVHDCDFYGYGFYRGKAEAFRESAALSAAPETTP